MSPRSSIFSFDTLIERPRIPRSLELTVGLCLAFRIVLGLGAGWLNDLPSHYTNHRLMYLEEKLVRQSQVAPKIVLMGNSLMRYGVIEDRLAAALDLETGQVVNLAVENGSPWEGLTLLTRNPGLLAEADLLVYELDWGQLHDGARERYQDYFYQLSSLPQKFDAETDGQRIKLVLDYLWPIRSQRRDLVTWLSGIAGDVSYKCPQEIRPAWEPGKLAKLRDGREIFDGPMSADRVIGYRGSYSSRYLSYLSDLVSLCAQRGVKVVLLHTPFRENYHRAIEQDAELAGSMEVLNQVADSVCPAVLDYGDRANRRKLGLVGSADYFDYVHMTPSGAAKLTDALADDLQTRGYFISEETEAKTISAGGVTRRPIIRRQEPRTP